MLERFGDDLVDVSKRILELTPIKDKKIKIAITGLSRSGKSVFITSFIDQLLNSHELFLHVKSSKKYNSALQAPKISMKRFDYYHFSKQIKKEHIWCDSTDSVSKALLKINSRSSLPFFGNDGFHVEIIDYPGEWILDLGMLLHTYTSWSNDVISWLREIDDKRVKDYLDKIDNLSTNETSDTLETSLHVEYVELLKHLRERNYSFLTPGRFLVPADLKDDPILLFAPLEKSNSKLYKSFKKRYESYVNDVVKKLHLDYFRGFDRQIVLIDVIKALQKGDECYKDMKKSLKSMLDIYTHAQGNLLSQIFNPTIQNVAFVATKADLVPSLMHDNYLSLLKEMSEDIRIRLQELNVKTSSHIVSSVKCTQSVMSQKDGQNIPTLRGIDAKSGKMVEVYPGKMPPNFPKNWNKNDYMYEDFLPPQKEYRADEAFDNLHVDKVIYEMIRS